MHGQIDKFARVCEFAEHDQEDYKARDPSIKLVYVHNLVAEERDEEGACCDYDDAGPAWYVAVHGVDQLSAHDDVDGRPAHTGEAIEDGYQLDTVVSKIVAGEYHLPETESRAKSAEEAHRSNAKHVDEQDGEERIHEAELEDRDGESADCERGDDHIRRHPLVV